MAQLIDPHEILTGEPMMIGWRIACQMWKNLRFWQTCHPGERPSWIVLE